MTPLTAVHFGSWDDYWAVRHDPTLWLPFARHAIATAGLDQPATLEMLVPSQYPTVRAGDSVVTIYPDPTIVRDSCAMEIEAHALLADRAVPVPRLRAHGEFPAGPGKPRWSWLIESMAHGVPWDSARRQLSTSHAQTVARSLGAALRELHDTPHDAGVILRPDWPRFRTLVGDELDNLGVNDARLEEFPAAIRPELRELAAATYATIETRSPTRLVHGDLHGENVFVEPASGALTAIIDLNEMYAGDAWYDLADACFRLFLGMPPLIEVLLDSYGWPVRDRDETARHLLGWGLLHDFPGLTSAVRTREIPTGDLTAIALHVTGLDEAGPATD